MVNENVLSGGAPEFPEFSTQITIANEDSTPKSKKNQQPAWNIEQNLVLISGWIKFGIAVYDGVKRFQGNGWFENDVLAKAQEIYECGKNVRFTLMEEWNALHDQPRYSSQVGSGSSGFKRSHESDACGSNSVRSSARPMGREAAKKKGKKKSKETSEVVEKEWAEFQTIKG
ncbi:uncharacterized protein LOC123885893 [Trifolium pratense]|uniref:uncharacterized protein LOC123885893 n=1 Tax=Trifolium pratense TaxID=57577 RepID=UPI001E696BB0|nr:uncharacterized protein LOC123885893 [Trifolium pratense]